MTEWTIEDDKALLKKLVQSNVNDLMKKHRESERKMFDRVCPKCFRALKTSTNTLVCLNCDIKWRIGWQDGKANFEEVKKRV
jgi:hypothetical protein